MKTYDICIIGAGWAGFNAALRAESLGLKVALIEQDEVGGTCLNRGCIPTKAYVHSAKVYALSKKAKAFGIHTDEPKVIFPEMKLRKDTIVKTLRESMQNILKNKKSIDFFKSTAKFASGNEISIDSEKISAKNILITSGSEPKELGRLKFNGKDILSSDELLDINELPRNLLIIGGGVIGCEFASIFSNLGCEVTIVEYMERLLPLGDLDISKKIETIFKKRKIKVMLNTDASKLDLTGFEKTLLCIGRRPNISNLGLKELGINLENERILIDPYMRTSIPHIFAAGDCASPIQLAHLAQHQAVMAVENIIHPAHMKPFDYRLVPNCVFTDPEIACVGLDESEIRKQGIDIRVERFEFLGSGMARILDETEGFIKIIFDKNTDKILGAVMLGPRVTELIATLTVAIKSGLRRPELSETIFAHPTLSEGIVEAVRKGIHGT